MLALVVCGCGKKESVGRDKAVADPQADVSAQPGTVPVGAPPPPVLRQPASITQSDGQADLKELNRCLLRWVLSNRRRPKSFEDFAATAGVPIPLPPADKKYVLGSNMHIQLVDR